MSEDGTELQDSMSEGAPSSSEPTTTPRDTGRDVVPPEANSDVTSLQAEVERLRAENEALAEKAAATGAHPNRGRRVAMVLLVILGGLLAGIAVPALWLNRTVMNTDQWVSTVAPLASDPAIQNAVGDYASNSIIERVNAEQVAKDALPEKAQILATPIANAVNSFIRQQTFKIVQSDQFEKLWTEANRIGHKAVIAAVTGHEGKAVTSADGKITVDLTALLKEVQKRLVDNGLEFVGKIPVSSLPNREITVVDSPALAKAGQAVDLMNKVAYALPLLALAVLAGAVGVAVDRRKAVLWVGIAIIVAMLLPIEAIYLAQYPYVNAIEQLGSVPKDAAQSVYTIVFAGLVTIQRNVLIFGLVLWAGAIIAGPARWAVALRRGVSHGMQGVGTAWDFGAFGEWVLAHKAGLRSIGLIAGVLALLFAGGSPLTRLIWVGILVLVWLLAVELFGRPRPAAAATALGSASGEPTAEESLPGDSDAGPPLAGV